MKKVLAPIFLLLLFSGCGGNYNVPLSNEIQIGMTSADVLSLYNRNKKTNILNIPVLHVVGEEISGNCINRTYRHYFMQPKDKKRFLPKPTPFLLTFTACKSNEDDVQKRRVICQKVIDEFCPKNILTTLNNKKILGCFLFEPDPGYTPYVLVKKEIDQVTLLRQNVIDGRASQNNPGLAGAIGYKLGNAFAGGSNRYVRTICITKPNKN